MGIPLTGQEVGKRIAQILFDTVKEVLPDKPNQSVQLKQDQQALYRAIFDAWAKEQFYGPSPMYQEAIKNERLS